MFIKKTLMDLVFTKTPFPKTLLKINFKKKLKVSFCLPINKDFVKKLKNRKKT